MFRLIAMDLDGTLLNSRSKLTKKTLLALEKLKQDHVYIVIASGRTDREIMNIIPELGLATYDRGYLIAFNGVETVKTDTMATIGRMVMAKPDVATIESLARDKGLYLHVFTKTHIYLSHDIPETLILQQESGCPQKRVDMANFIPEEEVFKILLLDERHKLDGFRKHLPEDLLQRMNVFKSSESLLEFVSKGTSKGSALANLINYLGLDKQAVIAFGDEENDLSLLQEAGIAVAMGNAIESIRQLADFVTLSNDLDGVAHTINMYIDGSVKNGI